MAGNSGPTRGTSSVDAEIAARILTESRLFEAMPDPADTCVCGHIGFAHVFSTADGEPIYCSCFEVPVHIGPGQKGWQDEAGNRRSATCRCTRFQKIQDSAC